MPTEEKKTLSVNLDDPSLYNNRELSWLSFNYRVLEEAMDEQNALLDRFKFLSIFSSNLDEFFMVRVAGLLDQVKASFTKPENKAGLTPKEQLTAIADLTHPLIKQQDKVFLHYLTPMLAKENVTFKSIQEVSPKELAYLETFFEEQVFPVLTPMAVDTYRPFPMISNKSLNLGVVIEEKKKEKKRHFPFEGHLVLVQVPSVIDRFVELPSEGAKREFVLLEEVISRFIDKLLFGYEVKSVTPFRITRNADLTIHEDEADDLLHEIEEELKNRKRGAAVRLEIQQQFSDERVVNYLKEELEIQNSDVYAVQAPLDLTFLFSFCQTVQSTHEHLAAVKNIPKPAAEMEGEGDIFEKIKKKDILLHHPYESFEPIIEFISKAAADQSVLAIKQTLYRVSGDSPIIESLKKAAENGKQVTVLVELKARFDEENNVQWARELERAGCHVTYGMNYLKTHSKITLVVRREKRKIQRYVHLGTGNYNDATAKIYTDMGLFTADNKIGIDATNFFNYLSGYMDKPSYHHLSVSPYGIRDKFIELIDQEIHFQKQNGNGRIILKMNSLTDKVIIKKLFEASIAGIKVDLIIRGICCLRPGIEGVSENITVRSIVGTFLEHTRIYCFHHNGKEKVYLSSADLMTRNMENRVEILFPLLKNHHKKRVHENLKIMLKDNVKAREQDPNGDYHYVKRNEGEEEVNSQQYLCDHVAGFQENAGEEASASQKYGRSYIRRLFSRIKN
ncbi:RNA degradosome polyphosphate kinase [Jeotgalibacillus proteolyticus]|uniref:Polyphosphate kinase n=1 Tax=Jeotgalibacillus proteolyticus TaxID=2082395 RepID=A0A2S5G7B6_9BACL|nr:RNA degradosome polyphosphate kinase [Jeotgalibacillus proteolyticus]PPA68843.1 RNA degradosome polyphosphate kinase [Jeotgalibacillus proteolyticus]